MEQENEAVASLNLPPLVSGKSSSLSGGHITREQTSEAITTETLVAMERMSFSVDQFDLDGKSVTEQLEFALPGEHPKVPVNEFSSDVTSV